MPRTVSSGDKRVTVTHLDNDVSTSVAGANGFETIFDLSPSTDIYYWLLEGDHPQLGTEGNLRLRFNLPQEAGGSTQIGDNATVRVIAQGPEEEDVDVLGRTWRYRRFKSADQYDEDDVVRLDLPSDVKITEAAHLKIQVDNSTNGNDVDLSQSDGFAEIEMYRGTEA